MFKTDVHLVSFILNGIAVPLPIFHGHLRHRVGGGDGPLPLLNEVREIPHPALARYRSERLSFRPVLHSHRSCSITTLPISSGVCTTGALGTCPCPWGIAPALVGTWTGAIYRCIYAIVFQDGISITRAHLEKYSLAPADRYRTTDACTTRRLPPCWTAGVREMLPCPKLLNVSRSVRHFSQYW